MNRSEKLSAIALVVIAALITYSVYSIASDCSDRGGVLVKGVFWYACVGSVK